MRAVLPAFLLCPAHLRETDTYAIRRRLRKHRAGFLRSSVLIELTINDLQQLKNGICKHLNAEIKNLYTQLHLFGAAEDRQTCTLTLNWRGYVLHHPTTPDMAMHVINRLLMAYRELADAINAI